MANAATVGAHLKAGLEGLMDKHPIIGDVRGRGLMVGVELVRDRTTKERAIKERDAVVTAAFERGLLVLGAGKNSIRFSPPLVLTQGAGGHGRRDLRRGALECCRRGSGLAARDSHGLRASRPEPWQDKKRRAACSIAAGDDAGAAKSR